MRQLRFLLIFIALFILLSCKSSTEPSSDGSQSNNQYGTPYANVPATKDIIMYEVNIRAFGPSNNFQSVISRLDSIKALNVNVIWLMPIYPIGKEKSVNSPYCIKDFKGVNPEFGTLSDLRQLVELAHSKNMAVILDWVANHTSWDNSWISNKNWYSLDQLGNIIIPPGTNWQDVAELNYDNLDMQNAMIDAMKYWIYQANIDGFRCDAADMVPYVFWKQAIEELNKITTHKLIFLAEGNRNDHFNAGFHINYSWDFYGKLKEVFAGTSSIANLFNTHLIEFASIPQNGNKLRFTTNHDESAWDKTPINLFNGKKGALSASFISIFLGGVPLIYGTQEVGVANNVPFFNNTNTDWSANYDMFSEYKKLLSLYSGDPINKVKTINTYYNNSIVAFSKNINKDYIIYLANIKNSTQNFTFPSNFPIKKGINVLTNSPINATGNIALNAYEYLMIKGNTDDI